MAGGASPYRKGTHGERVARVHLEAMGYYVTRAYMSRGAWDLLALAAGRPPLMVQVKTGEKGYMLPEERVALIKLAHHAGAKPVLCHVRRPHAQHPDVTWMVVHHSMTDTRISPDVLWGVP